MAYLYVVLDFRPVRRYPTGWGAVAEPISLSAVSGKNARSEGVAHAEKWTLVGYPLGFTLALSVAVVEVTSVAAKVVTPGILFVVEAEVLNDMHTPVDLPVLLRAVQANRYVVLGFKPDSV